MAQEMGAGSLDTSSLLKEALGSANMTDRILTSFILIFLFHAVEGQIQL